MSKKEHPQSAQMNTDKKTHSKHLRKSASSADHQLFDRIVSILEQARGNVVRAVNTNMVLAYWMIGREIVEEIQRGKGRAKYGEKVVETLSKQLTERYGQGFSVTNIWYFKQFYVTFQDRFQIPHPLGGESSETEIPHPVGTELVPPGKSFPVGSASLRFGVRPQITRCVSYSIFAA